MQSDRSGFTLVELSIVLVILGLLIGGVLSGQSLIKAAELRSATREFQLYQTALGAFKDKYFYLPGDLPNAVKYWGAQAGSTADGVDSSCAALTSPSTGQATCNGNGDGMISAIPAVNTNPHERFRFWQQLANAGLINGTYSGITGGASSFQVLPGTNTPRSKIASAGWFVWGLGNYSDSAHFSAAYGTALQLGAPSPTESLYYPALKPEDAYNIDMKLDDGKPNQGKVLSYRYSLRPECITSSEDAYQLSLTTPGCALLFISGY